MAVQIKRPAMTLRPGNKVAPKVVRQEDVEEQIEDLEIEETIEEKPAPKVVVSKPASNFDDISDSEYFQTSIVDLREMAEKGQSFYERFPPAGGKKAAA